MNVLTEVCSRRVAQPPSVGPQLVQASEAAAAAGSAASSAPSVPEVPDLLLPTAQPFVTVLAEPSNGADAAAPGGDGAVEAAAGGGDPARASNAVFRGAGVRPCRCAATAQSAAPSMSGHTHNACALPAQ